MNRAAILLQGLMNQLKAWFPRIQKALYATSVEAIAGSPTGEFTVVVKWTLKSGEAKQYNKLFDRSFVFGQTASLDPTAWTVQRRACTYAREIIAEVLQQRGV